MERMLICTTTLLLQNLITVHTQGTHNYVQHVRCTYVVKAPSHSIAFLQSLKSEREAMLTDYSATALQEVESCLLLRVRYLKYTQTAVIILVLRWEVDLWTATAKLSTDRY